MSKLSAVELERYLVPRDVPVSMLDAKNAFNSLTNREKMYAYFLSKGCWVGALIDLVQISPESPAIFLLFQKFFRAFGGDLGKVKEASSATDSEWHDVVNYAAGFYGNMSNYLSFGDTKLIPRIEKERMTEILRKVVPQKDGLGSIVDRMYDLGEEVRELGFYPSGMTTYYSPKLVKEDAVFIQGVLEKNGISPLNTRLFKTAEKAFELKTASVDILPPKVITCDNGVTLTVTYGDYSKILRKLASSIDAASDFAANKNQLNMCRSYVDHFHSGSIDEHKDSQRHWILDQGPVVESNIGFIETYRDPLGVRAEFEGLVAIVNKETSAKFGTLVNNAEKLLPLLPWPKEFEKDKFFRPDFTSLEVLCFANCGVPAGINIPNYDDIRQDFGFKNVSLGNVLSSRLPEKTTTFLVDKDQQPFADYLQKSFEVQVALHELLGHGSGKVFCAAEDGSNKNFAADVINPITKAPVDTWYRGAETWDSKFSDIASSYEECRAECVGIFLCVNPLVLEIFGHKDATEQKNVVYVNWLNMCRAGLLALEFYNPNTKVWGQAHMRARYAILQVLLSKANGLVKVTPNAAGDDLVVELDGSKIESHGVPAIGDFLAALQVHKATADAVRGRELYERMTAVDETWVNYRKIVLAKKKPRKVFVQPHMFVNEKGEVEYKDYPASPEGVIQSFLDRFSEADEELLQPYL